MKSISSFQEIYIYKIPIDMRKQINGLSILVEKELEISPFSNALFVFLNHQGTMVKFLYWDKTGFALWMKRLEKERFILPEKSRGSLKIEAKYLSLLLEGADIFKLKSHAQLNYQKIN